MERELHALGDKAQDIHTRIIRGTTNEFDRYRLLHDMQALVTGLRRQAGRAWELSNMIVGLGNDGPDNGGGRAA